MPSPLSTSSEHEVHKFVERPSIVDGHQPASGQHGSAVLPLLRLLRRRHRSLTRAAVIGLLVSTLAAFLLPKTYESTVQLMPPDNQTNGGFAVMAALTGSAGLSSLAGDVLGLKSSGELFVGILRSRTVQDRLIERFDLRRLYHVKYWEQARKRLASQTEIIEDRKTGIISLKVTDHDPKRAAALAQAYVQELDRLVATLTTSPAHRERIFLEQRLDVVKGDLDAAAKRFGQFASENTAIDIKEQARAMVEAAAGLQGELIADESALKGLEQIYTDDNVRARSLRARIAELRAQMKKLGGVPGGNPVPADGLGDGGFDIPSIRALPLLGVTYADLYLRTKIEESVYETLTKQYELAKVQEAKEIPSVNLLDAPNLPERKSGPPRLVIMILGTVLSFAVTALWIVVSFQWELVPQEDERKVFAREVFESGRDRVRRALQRFNRQPGLHSS